VNLDDYPILGQDLSLSGAASLPPETGPMWKSNTHLGTDVTLLSTEGGEGGCLCVAAW
jgi:hypothetical protein